MLIPNHVLILGAPRSGKIRLAQEVLSHYGGNMEYVSGSHSGVIERCTVSTKYYSMQLCMLIDEFTKDELSKDERNTSTNSPEESTSSKEPNGESKDSLSDPGISEPCDLNDLEGLEKWLNEFKSEECEELREVIDGIFLCIDLETQTMSYIELFIGKCANIRELVRGGSFDLFVCVVDASKKADTLEAEDVAIANGYEYIKMCESGKNEFSELLGKDRLIELLEAHEWLSIDKNTRTDLHYEENKLNKLGPMVQGLLEVEDDTPGSEPKIDTTMDLDVVFRKLQLAKENAEGMDPEQKDAYTKKVILEIIDYI